MSAFRGCVRTLYSCSRVSSVVCAMMGNRPMSSGISPKLLKSCVLTSSSGLSISSSVSLPVMNPTECLFRLLEISSSIPTNAPLQINRMFVVSIGTSFCSG